MSEEEQEVHENMDEATRAKIARKEARVGPFVPTLESHNSLLDHQEQRICSTIEKPTQSTFGLLGTTCQRTGSGEQSTAGG